MIANLKNGNVNNVIMIALLALVLNLSNGVMNVNNIYIYICIIIWLYLNKFNKILIN
jgi:hypothetical protein